jgi:hypothetical protein
LLDFLTQNLTFAALQLTDVNVDIRVYASEEGSVIFVKEKNKANGTKLSHNSFEDDTGVIINDF